ncbi:WD40 repeat domain-containing protein [Thioflexithrix psekupsensis]|nr:WD40 repeat domain-containing protein [Thioflexithrix psekupsensis]
MWLVAIYALGPLSNFFAGSIAARNTNKQLTKNEELEQQRAKVSREIAAYQAQTQIEITNANLAFQAHRLEREQALQRELAQLNSQRQLEAASIHRETALKLPEVHKLFENWPLRTVPSQILNAYPNKQPRPLRVLLSPPVVEFDKFVHPNPQIQQSSAGSFPKLEKRLAEDLRHVSNTYYPQSSDVRPVELLDGAWDSNRYHGGSSLRALYSMLQSEPVMVLDSDVDGDFLTFRVAYWGLGQESYEFQPVLSRLSYREILYAAAKARAVQWKTNVRDKLLAQGKDSKEINEKYGGDNALNLAILEEDEEMRALGIEVERHYRFNQQDWEVLAQVLSTYHLMTFGVISDGHFLIHHDTDLMFSELLGEVLKPQLGLSRESLVAWVVARYEDMFSALANERAYRVPLLRLQLAKGLASVASEVAEQQVIVALKTWFAGRLLDVAGDSLAAMLEKALAVTVSADAAFLTVLKSCLSSLDLAGLVEKIQTGVADVPALPLVAPVVLKEYAKQAPTAGELVKAWDADEFKARLEAKLLPIGQGRLLFANYEFKTGILPVRLSLLPWGMKYVSNRVQMLTVSREVAREWRQGEAIFPLYAKLVVNIEGDKVKDIQVLALELQVNGRYYPLSALKPDYQQWEILRTFRGHTNDVRSVAFSPDGLLALSGSDDKTLKLWEVSSGQCLRTFKGHGSDSNSILFWLVAGLLMLSSLFWLAGLLILSRVISRVHIGGVAFSPDGLLALSGSFDNNLKLWEVSSGQCLRTFEGHSNWVRSVAFSPDGLLALSGSDDKTLKLWEVSSGICLRTFEGHSDYVRSVAFSPDGLLALSGSDDKTLKLWNVSSGQCLRTFEGHSRLVFSVAFSPDGLLALSGSGDNTLKLWDVSSGQCLRTFSGHGSAVYSVAFSPDGLSALSGRQDKTLKLWDVSSGQCLRTFSGHSSTVYSVAFSPDGLSALSGSGDGTMILWGTR